MPRTHQDTNRGSCTVHLANTFASERKRSMAVCNTKCSTTSSHMDRKTFCNSPWQYWPSRGFVSRSESVSDVSKMEGSTCAIVVSVVMNDWQLGRRQSKCDQPRQHSLEKWFKPQIFFFSFNSVI